MTTVHLRQGTLFSKPQTVLVDGRRFLVDRTRSVVVPGCRVTIRVPETRVPGPDDQRELGIILDGFS